MTSHIRTAGLAFAIAFASYGFFAFFAAADSEAATRCAVAAFPEPATYSDAACTSKTGTLNYVLIEVNALALKEGAKECVKVADPSTENATYKEPECILTGPPKEYLWVLSLLKAQWNINGTPVASLLPSTTKAELELEDISNKGAVVCNEILAGKVGPGGEDEITSVLTTGEVAASLAAPLLCKRPAGTTCEESTTDIELSPENLPWSTLLVLVSEAYEDYTYAGAYTVSCLIIGIKITDECSLPSLETGGSATTVKNVTGGVEIEGEAKTLANCSVGGTAAGKVLTIAGNLISSTEGTLSVSE